MPSQIMNGLLQLCTFFYPAARDEAGAWSKWLPYIVLLAAILIFHPSSSTVSDVAWDLTLAEKVLAGKRLYIDIFEVNPPATVWLYLPAALAAQKLHLASETLVDAMVFAGAALSAGAAAVVLTRAGLLPREGRHWLFVAALAILLLVPNQCFGQREHFLTLGLLPFLALAAARSQGDRPSAGLTVVVGGLAGLSLCIKPHFALALAFPVLWACFKSRSWRSLLAVEIWTAALVVLLYTAAAVSLHPEFFRNILPLVMLAYVPVRLPLWGLIATPAMLLFAAGLVWLRTVPRAASPQALLATLVCAALGCCLAFAIQGKGWPYQSYPMLALLLMAGGCAVQGSWSRKRLPTYAMLALLSAATWFWLGNGLHLPLLRAELIKIQPPPRLLAISEDLGVGFPIVRQIGGTWTARVSSQWILNGRAERSAMGVLEPSVKTALDLAAAQDQKWLVEDIRQQHPDVILVQIFGTDWSRWAAADQEISAEMAAYADGGTFDGVQIMRRRSAN